MKAEIHRVTTAQFCRAIMRRVRHLRRTARRRGGKTVCQMEFSVVAGYSPDQIVRWERNHSTPKLRVALDCLEAAERL